MPNAQPPSESVTLQYAGGPPRWRKRAPVIILGVTITAAIFCGWQWGPYLRHQTRLLYWQRQCLTFTASPTTVVYEEDPAAAAALIRSRGGYLPYRKLLYGPSGYTGSAIDTATFRPPCEDELEKMLPYPISHWLPAYDPGSIVFLHERISPAGHRRLVCIWNVPQNLGPAPDLCFSVCVWSPATLFSETTPRTEPYGSQIPPRYPPAPVARIFAGQPDPADSSHFTIHYQMWGRDDILDGWLQDDDSIRFMPRHPPIPPTH
jgi:hypothetical protein